MVAKYIFVFSVFMYVQKIGRKKEFLLVGHALHALQQPFPVFLRFFVPFCEAGYLFEVCSLNIADAINVKSVIAAILQLYPINRSSNVEIHFNGPPITLTPTSMCFLDALPCLTTNKQLPVETVSNWLNQMTDGVKGKIAEGQTKERVLKISFGRTLEGVENGVEMRNHLEKVCCSPHCFALVFDSTF